MSVVPSTLPESNEAGLDLAARHLSASKIAAYRALGLSIVQGRRDGVYIRDLDGNAYIDCRSAGGVFDFGHRPRFAIDALTRAFDEVDDLGDWLLPSAVRARGAPDWLPPAARAGDGSRGSWPCRRGHTIG